MSWALKKAALHHPARDEVVQLMVTGCYRDQNNRWPQKLMGRIHGGWGRRFMFKMMFRMKPSALLGWEGPRGTETHLPHCPPPALCVQKGPLSALSCSPLPASHPRAGHDWAASTPVTKAQWERKIKPLSVAKPWSPYSTLGRSLRGLVKVQRHICGRGRSWIKPFPFLDTNLQFQLSVQNT